MRTATITMHRLLAVPALAAVLSLAGCGPPAREGKLAGHVPAKAVNVAAVELPDVGPEAAGRRFAMRADPGRLLYVYFGFVSCPDVCPATLSDLRKALRALGPDAKRIAVAFVTVDPARDSAGALVPYVRSFVSDGHALRPADQASLGRAEAAFGATSRVVRRADGEIEVSHTTLGYVVDERGDVLVQWDFGTPPEALAHDFAILLRRAAAGAPGVAIGAPWARATHAGASAGAAYLTLTSAVDDRLIGVAVGDSVAARAELHEVVREAGGRMTMRPAASLELPAGRPLALEPGAHHVMLIGLRRPLVEGDTLELLLRFERAPEARIRVPVGER